LLGEFGDAEIATLIAPRPLIIEHSVAPDVNGPPAVRDGRRDIAAPGRIRTPSLLVVSMEIARFAMLCPTSTGFQPFIQLVRNPDGSPMKPGSDTAIEAVLRKVSADEQRQLPPAGELPVDRRMDFDPTARQHRQVQQLVDHTQLLLHRAAATREAFWAKANTNSVDEWTKSCQWYREYLWNEVLGHCDPSTEPIEAQTRQAFDKPQWTGYEVKLNVNEDVFVWGYLLVPKDIKPGERRPVVVCQHGLEGLPMDVITDDPNVQGFAYYKAFAAKLAERGFVTFAPHHYYRGGDRFRQAQRLANPIKKTLFALTIAQHERLLDWLAQLPFVDASRVGFYGLSYGGFSAMRLPPIVERYALSIDSAEFNDMALKKASVHDQYSYPFHRTYEVFEFNLANTFGYADLAGLMAPRAFMVERGHQDGVAPDEWVASEYAKVRRRYAQLGIPDRTSIEFFNGPHTINGVGTFEFLERQLGPVK
jgi:cephalosporin-C deacetylase-like acetyl esterase